MSAFEADRFNRSRTSPHQNSVAVLVGSGETPQSLATVPKKSLQQLGTATSHYAAANLHSVIHLRINQNLHNRVNRAGFGVFRTVNQSSDAGVNQRSRTHRTWLNCNKQLTVLQTMVPDRATCIPECNYLGMSCGIGCGDVLIPTSSNNAAIFYNNGAYRNFAGVERALGCPQRFLHPEFVRA